MKQDGSSTSTSKPQSHARITQEHTSGLLDRLKEPAGVSQYWVSRMAVERGEAIIEIELLQSELKEFHKLKEYAKSLGQETYLELHAKNERLRITLQAIANTENHERDGRDITAATMRTFARNAIAKDGTMTASTSGSLTTGDRKPSVAAWQPIETAPKDGSRILGYGKIGFESDNGIGTVCFQTHYKVWNADPNEASEYSPEDCELTHWMPLPDAPAKAVGCGSPDTTSQSNGR